MRLRRMLELADIFVKVQKAADFISGVIEKELRATGKYDDSPAHKFGGSELERERFFWWALVNDALGKYADTKDDTGIEAAEKYVKQQIENYKKHHSAEEAKRLGRWLETAVRKLEAL